MPKHAGELSPRSPLHAKGGAQMQLRKPRSHGKAERGLNAGQRDASNLQPLPHKTTKAEGEILRVIRHLSSLTG